MKISFLVPAHNEEKIIEKTISHLVKIPIANYEILIGLDGCTDNTENIVKSYSKKDKKIRYFNLNLRKGKPEVVDFLIKKAKGDVIVINDADWLFSAKSKDKYEDYFEVFKDKEIGGIAESFPVEWDKNKLKKSNMGYQMVAYSTKYWLDYQKTKYISKKGKNYFLDRPTMFLTNIFRKELYKKNFSLGDDFERTVHIINSGKKIVIFKEEDFPRMKAIYDRVNIKDLFKQKIRTSIARKQLSSSNSMEVGLISYYIPSTWYIFKESWKESYKIGIIVSFWILINVFAIIISKFIKMETKEGWRLRARR